MQSSNKMFGMNDKLVLEKYVACYFDVLGTKQKDTVRAVNDMWLVSHCSSKEHNCSNKIIKKSFSDNYLVACKSTNDLSALNDIINNIGYTYSVALIDSNVLIRGAIVDGELAFTQDVVLGKALLDAYYLENDVAVYPRIILSNGIGIVGKQDYKDNFIVDEDGVTFLNCFKFINQKFLATKSSQLLRDLCATKKELESQRKAKEVAKINWLVNYLKSYINANFGKTNS